MQAAIIIILSLILTSLSFAEVQIQTDPISVTQAGGIDGLLKGVKREVMIRILKHIDEDTSSLDQFVRCAPVTEIKGAFICNSFYQMTMNDTFTRMGFFMGASKGFDPGTLMDLGSFQLANYKKLVAGHNLPGKVILDFYKKAQSLHPSEKDFRLGFLDQKQIQALGDQFYLIGTASQNSKPAKDVVSHEIYHAQYGLNPIYRATVDKFWKEKISAEDQQKIRETLGAAYNSIDEIIIDEAQAYLLQSNAQKDQLRDFSEKYSEPLRKELTQAGAAPLVIQ